MRAALRASAVLLLALLVSAAPAHARRVTAGAADLRLPCGPAGTTVHANWWFPETRRATGLVWVQHGFLRTSRNITTLARSIAAHTGAIVVAPNLSSNPFDPAGCWINGAPMHRAVAAALAERTALRRSARAARGRPVALPRQFVLTGHSAGGNLATAAAGATTAPGGAIADLQAVVLYDAVDANGAMEAGLARLTGADDRPVLQIAAPPSACNAGGSGTRALARARPDRFIGVLLRDGTHIDAEGPDTGPIAPLICGTPRPANVRALRVIASSWIAAALAGRADEIPFGSPGEVVPLDGTAAVVLPAP